MDNVYNELKYWVDYLGYEAIDEDELFDYILNSYVKDEEGVINNYVEAMKIKVPNLQVLDTDYIINEEEDYVKIGEDMFLNIFQLEDDEPFLRKNKLIY